MCAGNQTKGHHGLNAKPIELHLAQTLAENNKKKNPSERTLGRVGAKLVATNLKRIQRPLSRKLKEQSVRTNKA